MGQSPWVTSHMAYLNFENDMDPRVPRSPSPYPPDRQIRTLFGQKRCYLPWAKDYKIRVHNGCSQEPMHRRCAWSSHSKGKDPDSLVGPASAIGDAKELYGVVRMVQDKLETPEATMCSMAWNTEAVGISGCCLQERPSLMVQGREDSLSSSVSCATRRETPRDP